MNRETLEQMLCDWARFYLSEFDDIAWQKISISGRMIEAAKLGIFSTGTNKRCLEFFIPQNVEDIQKALIEIPASERQVIKSEYVDPGSQRKKAYKLGITVQNYRARLCRARKRLIVLL